MFRLFSSIYCLRKRWIWAFLWNPEIRVFNLLVVSLSMRLHAQRDRAVLRVVASLCCCGSWWSILMKFLNNSHFIYTYSVLPWACFSFYSFSSYIIRQWWCFQQLSQTSGEEMFPGEVRWFRACVKSHLLYFAQTLLLTQPLETSSVFCLRKGESEPSFLHPHLKLCKDGAPSIVLPFFWVWFNFVFFPSNKFFNDGSIRVVRSVSYKN